MYSFNLYISILFSYLSVLNYFIILFYSNSLLISVLLLQLLWSFILSFFLII